MSNFFVNLMKLTERKEDCFTECLAETLRSDQELAKAFLEKLCGPVVGGIRVSRARIKICTRVPFEVETRKAPESSTVDMVFSLEDRVEIGVENKLNSPEGKTDDGKTQLEKYLKLIQVGDLAKLSYITGYYANVTKRVLDSPDYLFLAEHGAKKRDHFMWMDFYPIIEKRASMTPSTLVAALVELFKAQGFEPPSATIGDLNDPDLETRTRNKKNFAHYWDLTREELKKRGWGKIGPSDRSGLYAEDGRSKRLEWVWFNPNYDRLLRAHLTPKRGVDRNRMIQRLQTLEEKFGPGFRADSPLVDRSGRGGSKSKAPIIRILYPLNKLVDNKNRIRERLAEFVREVLDNVG